MPFAAGPQADTPGAVLSIRRRKERNNQPAIAVERGWEWTQVGGEGDGGDMLPKNWATR